MSPNPDRGRFLQWCARAIAAFALLVGVSISRTARREPDPIHPVAGPILRTIVAHPWLSIGVAAAFGAVGGFIFMASGVIPIKASSGHWRITAAILDFAKVRSFTTHSLTVIQPYSLDDPALVLRGAGHYENGCYPCHGRPGGGIPPVMAALTPPPPDLSSQIGRWKPEELFSIVKHGIKFTGMPAWPVLQRDDEVWAMVAFLRRMPSLDSTAYRALVYGQSSNDQSAPQAVRDICWRCHGADGTGRGPGAFPSLAGQRSDYLYESLRAFADRRRFSGIMITVVSNLDDRTMREAAAYYERLPMRAGEASGNTRARERGESIATHGVPDRDIPSCNDCHGPGDTPKNPAYPRLAGQHTRYLALQLELFQQRRRGGSPFANLMHVFVGRLQPDQISEVTTYYGSLATPP
jgi:cytochrome c553